MTGIGSETPTDAAPTMNLSVADALAEGGEQTEPDAGNGPEHERADRHRERVGQGTGDDVRDVFIGLERFAEAGPLADGLGAGSADHPRRDQPAHVVDVLDQERLVHAEGHAGLGDAFGSALLAAGGRRRIGRTQLEKREGDEADGDEKQDQGACPAKDESDHGAGCGPPGSRRTARLPSGLA